MAAPITPIDVTCAVSLVGKNSVMTVDDVPLYCAAVLTVWGAAHIARVLYDLVRFRR